MSGDGMSDAGASSSDEESDDDDADVDMDGVAERRVAHWNSVVSAEVSADLAKLLVPYLRVRPRRVPSREGHSSVEEVVAKNERMKVRRDNVRCGVSYRSLMHDGLPL